MSCFDFLLAFVSYYSGIKDYSGVYGSAFHYAMILFLVGGAFILFIYLWKKGRLDMDESPKIQMMESEEKERNK